MSLLEERAFFFLHTFFAVYFSEVIWKIQIYGSPVEESGKHRDRIEFFTCTEWLKTNKSGIKINISYMYCIVM